LPSASKRIAGLGAHGRERGAGGDDAAGARESAGDVAALHLSENRVRQDAITAEIVELAGGGLLEPAVAYRITG
jgi:hypothetical protein